MAYRLVIHDDASHSFAYVIELLTQLGLSPEVAHEKTFEIDESGRSVLPMPDLATAEATQERIFSHGPDPSLERSRASLMVSIELEGTHGVHVVNCGRVGSTGFERLDAAGVERVQRESRAELSRVTGAADAFREAEPLRLSPGEMHGAIVVFAFVIAGIVAFAFLAARH